MHPGADQSLRVLREIGIDAKDSVPRLYLANKDSKQARVLLAEAGVNVGAGMVTINPFSRWQYKEWNSDKWGKVIDALWAARQIPAVLIGSPEEFHNGQAIVAGREGRAFNLAGKTTLSELAAVIALSSLHLGVDSAAPHIAAALGTPTVTLHGPSDRSAWRLVDDHHRVVSSVMYCLPCGMKGCNDSGKSKCLDDLAIAPVVHAALDILELVGQRWSSLDPS